MSGRLPTHLLAGALLRQASAAGGFATLLARGDNESGGLVILCRETGRIVGLRELSTNLDGRPELRPVGPESLDEAGAAAWIAKRCRYDTDLWVIDLDIAGPERFAAETIALN